MKIYGGKKDYWDTALGFGADSTLHYNRTEFEMDYRILDNKLPRELTRFLDYNNSSRDGWRYIQEEFVVGFCGRIFPCIYIEKQISFRQSIEIQYIYDSANAIEILDLKKDEKWSQRWWRGLSNTQTAEEFYKFRNHANDEIFVELGAPVFTLRTKTGHGSDRHGAHRVTVNPNLKEMQFYKVVDSFTAFQEISMYLGNQLVRRDAPDEIADKYKISQHGFDTVYSFRKRP